jgi:hypothetical protein
VIRFRHLERGGRYLRVADPAWSRTLDPSYAQLAGGRWNPPASFPVLYLCADLAVARANVLRRFAGLPYGVLDLVPDRRPILVDTDVPPARVVDLVGDAGCSAAGLPTTYPFDARARRIGWNATQPIGLAAWDQGERGLACRSAALGTGERGEELAWFVRERTDRLRVAGRRGFDAWFPPAR